MLKEFKEFINKGSLVDLAVAVILAGVFGAVVKSLVNDVIMPVVGLFMGGVDFAAIYINLTDTAYATLAEAEEAGAAVIKIGVFLNAVITFLITALVIFLIVKAYNKSKKKEEDKPKAPPAPSKEEVLLTEIRDLLKR